MKLSYCSFLFVVSFFLFFLSTTKIKTYFQTNKEDWTIINANGDNVQTVDPVLLTTKKDFSINIINEEIAAMKDASGNMLYMWFNNVIEFSLLRFNNTVEGQKSLWK